MAYDPADLRLPPWILRFLNLLVALRIPIGKKWRIGMTRAGALMFFSLFGLWAAALYSANNLLYLCGGMLSAITISALWQGIYILRQSPKFASSLPSFVETNSPVILRQKNSTAIHIPGLIHIHWQQANLHLDARLSSHTCSLMAQLHSGKRANISLKQQTLTTSAPLGLWELEYQRQDQGIWTILPKPVAWLNAQASSFNAEQHYLEGDEYHDLRAYMPGDAVARIHWRKSTLEPSTWRIKRFTQPEQQPHDMHLRVDLRLPEAQPHTAFERLLGMAWHWLKSQPENSRAHMIIGQQQFHLSKQGQTLAAIRALAASTPESIEPLQGEGMLLSLVADT